MTFADIPFIALDYLKNGNFSNLTQKEIELADSWAEMFEITSVETFVESDTISTKIVDSLLAEMDFDNDDELG